MTCTSLVLSLATREEPCAGGVTTTRGAVEGEDHLLAVIPGSVLCIAQGGEGGEGAEGEAPKKKLAYEVVSIKPHAADDRRIMINLGTNAGGRLNLVGAPLPLVIQLGYSESGLGRQARRNGPSSAAYTACARALKAR